MQLLDCLLLAPKDPISSGALVQMIRTENFGLIVQLFPDAVAVLQRNIGVRHKKFTEGERRLLVDPEEPRLLLPTAAIELQRLSQPLACFGSVRLALKHDVRHAELGIATY